MPRTAVRGGSWGGGSEPSLGFVVPEAQAAPVQAGPCWHGAAHPDLVFGLSQKETAESSPRVCASLEEAGPTGKYLGDGELCSRRWWGPPP